MATITGQAVQDRLRRDNGAFNLWLQRALPEDAWRYYETDQAPAHLDIGSKFWVTLNRVRDSQNSRMGFLANTPPVWVVKGSTHDRYDRDRAKLIARTLRWQSDEAGLLEEIQRGMFDCYLAGMGGVAASFDPMQITSIDTVGCLKLSWRDPMMFRPDSRARKGHTLDGRHFSYIRKYTRDEFYDEFHNQLDADGKKVDVDKIFKEAKDKDTLDFVLNADADDGDEKTIHVIQHDYWITREKKLSDKLTIPWREYRIALVAGKTVLHDAKSPLDSANTWSTILFYNQPLKNLPYSGSDFQSEKQIQDLINTMLSMSINNQARQMNSPILAHKGSMINPDHWKANASKAGAILTWEYTPDMANANIPPGIAKPSRMGPGQESSSWMQTLMWVSSEFQNVSMRDVIRGENAGATSGVQLQQLQGVALQPTYFAKQKLLGSLGRLGNSIYTLVKRNVTEEIEIPVDDEGIGDERGVIINHKMSGVEIAELLEEAQSGDKTFEDANSMLSVRTKGGEAISI